MELYTIDNLLILEEYKEGGYYPYKMFSSFIRYFEDVDIQKICDENIGKGLIQKYLVILKKSPYIYKYNKFELKVGTFLYPFVYDNHAFSALITVASDLKHCDLTFYNSGRGVNYHGIYSKDLVVPSGLIFKHLDSKNVIEAMHAMYYMCNMPQNDKSITVKENIGDFYYWFFTLLLDIKKFDENALITYSNNIFDFPHQITGDCTFKSIFMPLFDPAVRDIVEPNGQYGQNDKLIHTTKLYNLYLKLQMNSITKYINTSPVIDTLFYNVIREKIIYQKIREGSGDKSYDIILDTLIEKYYKQECKSKIHVTDSPIEQGDADVKVNIGKYSVIEYNSFVQPIKYIYKPSHTLAGKAIIKCIDDIASVLLSDTQYRAIFGFIGESRHICYIHEIKTYPNISSFNMNKIKSLLLPLLDVDYTQISFTEFMYVDMLFKYLFNTITFDLAPYLFIFIYAYCAFMIHNTIVKPDQISKLVMGNILKQYNMVMSHIYGQTGKDSDYDKIYQKLSSKKFMFIDINSINSYFNYLSSLASSQNYEMLILPYLSTTFIAQWFNKQYVGDMYTSDYSKLPVLGFQTNLNFTRDRENQVNVEYMMGLTYVQLLSKVKYIYDATNVKIPLLTYTSIQYSIILYRNNSEDYKNTPYIFSGSDFFYNSDTTLNIEQCLIYLSTSKTLDKPIVPFCANIWKYASSDNTYQVDSDCRINVSLQQRNVTQYYKYIYGDLIDLVHKNIDVFNLFEFINYVHAYFSISLYIGIKISKTDKIFLPQYNNKWLEVMHYVEHENSTDMYMYLISMYCLVLKWKIEQRYDMIQGIRLPTIEQKLLEFTRITSADVTKKYYGYTYKEKSLTPSTVRDNVLLRCVLNNICDCIKDVVNLDIDNNLGTPKAPKALKVPNALSALNCLGSIFSKDINTTLDIYRVRDNDTLKIIYLTQDRKRGFNTYTGNILPYTISNNLKTSSTSSWFTLTTAFPAKMKGYKWTFTTESETQCDLPNVGKYRFNIKTKNIAFEKSDGSMWIYSGKHIFKSLYDKDIINGFINDMKTVYMWIIHNQHALYHDIHSSLSYYISPSKKIYNVVDSPDPIYARFTSGSPISLFTESGGKYHILIVIGGQDPIILDVNERGFIEVSNIDSLQTYIRACYIAHKTYELREMLALYSKLFYDRFDERQLFDDDNEIKHVVINYCELINDKRSLTYNEVHLVPDYISKNNGISIYTIVPSFCYTKDLVYLIYTYKTYASHYPDSMFNSEITYEIKTSAVLVEILYSLFYNNLDTSSIKNIHISKIDSDNICELDYNTYKCSNAIDFYNKFRKSLPDVSIVNFLCSVYTFFSKYKPESFVMLLNPLKSIKPLPLYNNNNPKGITGMFNMSLHSEYYNFLEFINKHIEPDNNKYMLYYYTSGILPRDNQNAFIDLMYSSVYTKQIYNIPMGFGKSKVLIPLLTLKFLSHLSANNASVFIITPIELVEQTYETFTRYVLPTCRYKIIKGSEGFHIKDSKGSSIYMICIISDIDFKTQFLKTDTANDFITFLNGKTNYFIVDEADKILNPITSELQQPDDTLLRIQHFHHTFKTLYLFLKEIYSPECRIKGVRIIQDVQNDFTNVSPAILVSYFIETCVKYMDSNELLAEKDARHLFTLQKITKDNVPHHIYEYLYNVRHVTNILDNIIKLKNRVDYGFSNKSSTGLIIPFKSLDVPNETGQFSDPLVILCLTIIAYINLDKVIPSTPVRTLFSNTIIKDMFMSMTNYGKFNTTYRQKLKTSINIDTANNDELIHGMFDIFPFIYDICKTSVVYNKQFNVSTGMHIFNAKQIIGLTGTAEAIVPFKVCDTDIKINRRSAEHQKQFDAVFSSLSMAISKIETVIPDSPIVFLDKILSKVSDLCCCLIDVSSILIGVTYKDVLTLVHKWMPQYTTITYWNSDHIMLTYTLPMILNGTPLNVRETMFWYFDAQHTTGIDTVLPPDARGVVIIDPLCTYRDFMQGCYRLRNIGKGQSMEVYISSDTVPPTARNLEKILKTNDDVHLSECKNIMLKHEILCKIYCNTKNMSTYNLFTYEPINAIYFIEIAKNTGYRYNIDVIENVYGANVLSTNLTKKISIQVKAYTRQQCTPFLIDFSDPQSKSVDENLLQARQAHQTQQNFLYTMNIVQNPFYLVINDKVIVINEYIMYILTNYYDTTKKIQCTIYNGSYVRIYSSAKTSLSIGLIVSCNYLLKSSFVPSYNEYILMYRADTDTDKILQNINNKSLPFYKILIAKKNNTLRALDPLLIYGYINTMFEMQQDHVDGFRKIIFPQFVKSQALTYKLVCNEDIPLY